MRNYRDNPLIPVYFPFTFVSRHAMAILERCFPKIAVLQPSELPAPPAMVSWVDQQRLEVRVPVSGDAPFLQAAVSDFRRWAQVHHGAVDAFRFHGQSPFLYDDDSAASIRDQLRAASNPTPHKDGNDRFLFAARVFLQLAQEFDAQQLDVDGHLQAVSRMQQDMLDRIHGNGPTLDSRADACLPASKDDGLFMTDTRLKAWSRLWMSQPVADDSDACFVTCSPAVWQQVMEQTPQSEPVLQIPFPGPEEDRCNWHQQVQQYAVDPMAGVAVNDMAKSTGGLFTAVRVPGKATEVFGSFAGAAHAPSGVKPGVLLGLLTL